jgi:DNA-binding transcriptional ArsR family regulator
MEFTGNQQQPVWRALFHPTRRQIIRLLQEKSRTTGELSNFFDVTRYAVMKHLQVLEQADLIHVRREGRLRWNVLNPERLQEVPADYLERWRSGADDQDEVDDLMNIEAGVASLAYEVVLPVSAEDVYQAFVHHIDRWWPDRSLDGSKLIFEPFVGGRFYEAMEDGATGVLLGFVTCLRPTKEIRLWGPMDAEEEAAVNTIRIQLEEADGRTHLYLSHHTAGEVDDALVPLSTAWQERLDHHLRKFLTE